MTRSSLARGPFLPNASGCDGGPPRASLSNRVAVAGGRWPRYPGCAEYRDPYSSPVPQVSACGGAAAARKPGADDACGGDLPRGSFLWFHRRGRICCLDASRHAAPRYEQATQSVTRFSPDFRARRCAWTADECSDDGDHASTIRVSLGPSQRVDEAFVFSSFSRRSRHG